MKQEDGKGIGIGDPVHKYYSFPSEARDFSRGYFTHDYYCYADMPKYKADLIFVKNRVRVTFLKEYEKENEKYIMIMCRVKKKIRELLFCAWKN